VKCTIAVITKPIINSANKNTIISIINNINSISGGTGGQVTSYSPTATQLFSQQSRNFFLRGGQLLGFPISIGSASDITGALPTLSAITFDPTIDNYLITAVALMTVGDLVFQESILITN